MAKVSEKGKQRELPIDAVVKEYVAGLDDKHRMLVVLKAQLYDGGWEPMLDDLNNRLAGNPYIFKLINRIKDDVERIGEMQAFEREHGVDLSDHVTLP